MNQIFNFMATEGSNLFNGQEVRYTYVKAWPYNMKYLVGMASYVAIVAVLCLILFFLIKKNVLKGHNKGIGIFVTAMAVVVIGLIINAVIGNFGAI
ncbi:MAG: hypothetical protein LBS41_06675 [Streptococcaceae bacterium]|jgi:uncharacterized BrkB/YihY/UPF0761 family membrane protein|nr:hypothetical protein [Streptococcaceae bacterium]